MERGSAFSAHNKRWVEEEIHSPPGAGCFSVLLEIQKQSLKRKGQKGEWLEVFGGCVRVRPFTGRSCSCATSNAN